MVTRRLFLVLAVSSLALGSPALGPGRATAQDQEPPIEGLDKLSPDEQARVRQNLERWKRMTPEQRQRAIENYRHWKSMTPEERQQARPSLPGNQKVGPRLRVHR